MHILLEKLYQGENLSHEESGRIFREIIQGNMNEPTLASVLTALKIKGETPDEIAGAALALRDNCLPFDSPDYIFADSCGTGGDKQSTINVSTAAAILAAECGLPMVKHGNRSVTSKCGSADVLSYLGVNVNTSPDVARKCLDQTGVAFLFAPSYHPGIKNAMGVRKALSTRTIFNVLGPLINPSRPPVQIMGVFDPDLCQPLAETLHILGAKSAMVVHGSGLDEVALHGPTTAAILKDGEVKMHQITPAELGLATVSLETQRGGDVATNAALLEAQLGGKGRLEHAQFIAANTGPLLYLAGIVPDMKTGAELALDTLATGQALLRLQGFITATKLTRAA